MSHASHSNRKRLAALLADRAVFGLDAARRRRLERLAAASAGAEADLDSLERVAAVVALACLSDRLEPMPEGLRQTLRLAASASQGGVPRSNGH